MLLKWNVGIVRRCQQLAGIAGLMLLTSNSVAGSQAGASAAGLTLLEAERIALAIDEGVKQFSAQSRMIEQESIAASGWMDPKLSIGTMNLRVMIWIRSTRECLSLKWSRCFPGGTVTVSRNAS